MPTVPFLSFLRASVVFAKKERTHFSYGSKHLKGTVKEEPMSDEDPQH